MRIDITSVVKMLLLVYVAISTATIGIGISANHSVATIIFSQYIAAILITELMLCVIWVVSEVFDYRWIWFFKTDRNSSEYTFKIWFESILHFVCMLFILSVYCAVIYYTTSEATQVYIVVPIVCCIGCVLLSYQMTKDYYGM